MNLAKALLIFIFAAALSGQLMANSIEKQRKQVEDQLKFELEFHDFALKMSRRINGKIGKQNLYALPENEANDLLKKHISEFSVFYQKHYKIPDSKIVLLKKTFEKLDLKAIKTAIRSSIIGSRVFIKQHGLGMALAVALGHLTDILIITLSGPLGLAKYLVSIPYGLIYSNLFNIIAQIKLRYKISRAIGGEKKYKIYMQEKNHIAKELGLGNPYRWFLPNNKVLIPVGDSQAASVPRYFFLPNFIHNLGIVDEELNYSNLLIWMKKNNIKSDFITHVKDNTSLKQWQKVGNLVWHIMNQQPEEVKYSFVMRFGEQFRKVNTLPNYKSLMHWTLRMMNAKSLEEVEDLLHYKTPKNTPAVVILGLWNEFILPHYAYRKDFTQNNYRKTVFESKVLMSSADYEKSRWSKTHSQRTFELLKRSFKNKNFSQCYPKHEKILFSLLQQFKF